MTQILTEALFCIYATKLETWWDLFEVEFEKAILLVENLLLQQDVSRARPLGRGHYEAFTATPILTKSLQYIAKICRHPVLRRRAIALLKDQ